MKNFSFKIHVNADSQTIWDVLTNLDQYTSWNPFIIGMDNNGDIKEGQRIKLFYKKTSNQQTAQTNIDLISCEENTKIVWRSSFVSPVVWSRYGMIELHPVNTSGTQVVFYLWQKGVFSTCYLKKNTLDVKAGICLMLQALKVFSEKQSLVTPTHLNDDWLQNLESDFWSNTEQK